MNSQEIFGFIGGGLIAVALIPQVIRLFKLRSAREISLIFTSLFLLGGVFWLIYGITLHSLSMIVSNSLNIILTSAMLLAKLRYGQS